MEKTRTKELEALKAFRKTMDKYKTLFRPKATIETTIKKCEYTLKDYALTDIYYTLDAAVLIDETRAISFYNALYETALSIIDEDAYKEIYNKEDI